MPTCALVYLQELYYHLPVKTLSMLQYGLTSYCKYSHIMKIDDDVYLRPRKLLTFIQSMDLDTFERLHMHVVSCNTAQT